jgi:hypothetical protein
MTCRFADEALIEYIAAGRYYNRQVPGLQWRSMGVCDAPEVRR